MLFCLWEALESLHLGRKAQSWERGVSGNASPARPVTRASYQSLLSFSQNEPAFRSLMLGCEISISPVISLRFKTHLVLWLPRTTRWTFGKTWHHVVVFWRGLGRGEGAGLESKTQKYIHVHASPLPWPCRKQERKTRCPA